MVAGSALTRGFRPEIQALRAFAVLIVVLNHLWPGQTPGGFVGVDIFFVISGYLITSHLLKEAVATGRVRLAAFWSRRARRLLPASMLVLLFCIAGVLLWVPMGQWQIALGQVAGAAVYAVNWVLMAQATDYFTSANSPSPVTHYWSLSVEEQFYLAWPILVLLVFALALRLKRRPVVWLAAALVVVFAASMIYSVLLSGQAPAVAYFSTFTRVWEFSAGGLLAVLLGSRSLPSGWAVWASWIGWAGLIASVVLITPAMAFPGWAALLPVLSTVLVIAARSNTDAPNLNNVTAFAPLQFLGGISYSLYLWHWPLIILVPYALGRDIGTLWRLAILVVSVLLAWATKTWIEDPARTARFFVRRRSWVTLVATGAAMVLVVGAALAPSASVDQRRDSQAQTLSQLAFDPPECFGALAVINDCAQPHLLQYPDSLLSTYAEQGGEVPGIDPACSTPADAPRITVCVYGPPADEATRTVALMGDSHAVHYTAALEKLAATQGWRVISVAQSGCMPVAFDDQLVPLWAPETAEECRLWADQAVPWLANDPEINTVIYSSISREYGYLDGTPTQDQDISESYVRTWQPWLDAGKKVLVVADTAFLQRGDVLSCIARADAVEDACASDRSVVLSKPDPMVTAVQRIDSPQVGLFDPNDYICDERLCHAIVGGIPVFVDHNHLLQAFAMTLAEPLAQAQTRLEGHS
ncbi:acyltransferase family protein [Microbacterium binotii]|uniref:Acyltransferase family protein n=1 Tax=Microbacterium binotii TaxID=462710 RepID=A0ABN3P6Y4_9MICO